MKERAGTLCPISFNCHLADLCQNNGEAEEPIAKIIHINRGDFLYRDYTDRKNTYVILSGLMAMSAIDKNGESVTMGIFGRGSALGETEPFARNHYAEYLLTAYTECEICKIPSATIIKATEENPRFALKLIDSTNFNYTVMNRQIWMLSTMSLKERIHRLFLNIAWLCPRVEDGFLVELTHEDIAQLISSERTSVTHALKKLEQEGRIKLRYRAILLSPDYHDAKLNDHLVPYPTWLFPNTGPAR
ncbi:MAG: Crp/Fnr family transcriptional regulator [Eggerthellaceae bacterium]|nr:Crp/Fnr family transcriptional regulator [Eggerthellaceae bacterium]